MADTDTVPVLVNAAARRTSARRRRAVERALAFAGRRAEFHQTERAEDIDAWIDAQAEAGHERALIVGGDGLVHRAIQRAAPARLALGIVPTGTGNDFARALQLGTDAAAAVAAALIDPVAIDALRVDGDRLVASVITLGFSGDVNARANRLRWPRGSLRYSVATMLELRRLGARPLRITLDDRTVLECDATILAIANTGYFGGGMWIAPPADPADGLLDICVIGRVRRFELLRVFPKVFRGSHAQHPAVSMHRARRVAIEAVHDEPVEVWGDGEPLGTLPISVAVDRAALRIAGARPVEPK